MTIARSPITTALLAIAIAVAMGLAEPAAGESPYAEWKNGPPTDPDYFPIGVWLQSTSPSRVAQYQAAGFNLYVGLWRGPTETQLANLKQAGMKAICAQNAVGLNSANNDVIVGWMQQDEPDNAQWNAETQSYDPPVDPAIIQQRYADMQAADSTRPIFLNLGQGAAWDGYWGRGVRTNHPEDYPLYLQGCDIGSFDIYPYAMNDDDSRYVPNDKPWYIPGGVDRLIDWTDGQKIVWNFVECTNIHGYDEATPAQVRAEVWMSLVHGSQGILYFVHEFDPFIEAGLLADPAMTAEVTDINTTIGELAPVLNSPTVADGATVASSNPEAPVDIMVKHHDGVAYLFAVAMRDSGSTTATFDLAAIDAAGPVEVIGEDRTVQMTGGSFQDAFEPLGVHLYRTPLPTGPRVAQWESLATHGPTGTVAVPVADLDVEPRAEIGALRVTFDTPLDPATVSDGSVTVVGQTSGALALPDGGLTLSDGDTVLTITLPTSLGDDVWTISLDAAIADAAGNAIDLDRDLVLRRLRGDIDADGVVTAADVVALREHAGATVAPATGRWDIDLSGRIDGADRLAVRQRIGNALP